MVQGQLSGPLGCVFVGRKDSIPNRSLNLLRKIVFLDGETEVMIGT